MVTIAKRFGFTAAVTSLFHERESSLDNELAWFPREPHSLLRL